MPKPIELAKERRIVARLLLSLLRAFAQNYAPHLGIAASHEFQVVILTIMIGHLDDRPLTISDISRALEMPRATVLRRVKTLIDLGFVKKVGRHYCVRPEAVNGPRSTALARGNVRRVVAAAKDLSKLDK